MEYSALMPLVFIFVGLLEIIMGIPLLLGKIKPNALYGFRTPKTRSSDEIWYKANKYFGRDFLIVGIIITICSLFLLVCESGLSVIELSWIGILILTIPLVAVVVRSLVYLKKL